MTQLERNGSGLVRRSKKDDAMIAAFATLAFLATLWLLIVVGAAVLEDSGAKIAAALKGDRRPALRFAPARSRARSRLQPAMPARPRLRDAA